MRIAVLAVALAAIVAPPVLSGDGFKKGGTLPEATFEKWYNHIWPATMEHMAGRPLLIEFWATW